MWRSSLWVLALCLSTSLLGCGPNTSTTEMPSAGPPPDAEEKMKQYQQQMQGNMQGRQNAPGATGRP